MRHVVFSIGQERFALPLGAVRLVVAPAAMSRVPRSPPTVRGIMNLRGRVVTVVDLAPLLGVGPGAPPVEVPPGRIVLLDRGRRDLGLLVSAVEGVLNLPDVAPAPGETAPSVRGVAHAVSGAVTVLDADGLDRQIADLVRPPAPGATT